MVAPQTDIDISEEIARLNRNIYVAINYAEKLDFTEIDPQIQAAVQTELYRNWQSAIDSIEEYLAYEPLREHLLSMVMWGPHVQVEKGTVTQIWDEDYAGNYSDVRAGQIAAGADFSRSPLKRSIGWKIIYDAAMFGVDAAKYWKAVDDQTYADIIDARLAFWGEKAPYWIFVEWGTSAGSGPGMPYPSFSGRNPIYTTRINAQRIVQGIIDEYEDLVSDTIVTYVEERFVEDEVDPRDLEIRVLTAWSRAFYRWGRWIQQEYRAEGGGFTGRWREVAGPTAGGESTSTTRTIWR